MKAKIHFSQADLKKIISKYLDGKMDAVITNLEIEITPEKEMDVTFEEEMEEEE